MPPWVSACLASPASCSDAACRWCLTAFSSWTAASRWRNCGVMRDSRELGRSVLVMVLPWLVMSQCYLFTHDQSVRHRTHCHLGAKASTLLPSGRAGHVVAWLAASFIRSLSWAPASTASGCLIQKLSARPAVHTTRDHLRTHLQFVVKVAQGGTQPFFDDRMVERHVQHV